MDFYILLYFFWGKTFERERPNMHYGLSLSAVSPALLGVAGAGLEPITVLLDPWASCSFGFCRKFDSIRYQFFGSVDFDSSYCCCTFVGNEHLIRLQFLGFGLLSLGHIEPISAIFCAYVWRNCY